MYWQVLCDKKCRNFINCYATPWRCSIPRHKYCKWRFMPLVVNLVHKLQFLCIKQLSLFKSICFQRKRNLVCYLWTSDSLRMLIQIKFHAVLFGGYQLRGRCRRNLYVKHKHTFSFKFLVWSQYLFPLIALNFVKRRNIFLDSCLVILKISWKKTT